MTQPTNTFSSYDAIGNREDLSDIIKIVDQEKTPFMSSIAGTTKATARLHEWQTDSLDSASATNAVVEGDDVVGDAITPTARKGNRIQISEKAVTVTDLQNMLDSAGRDEELAYQINRQSRSIKRDMEASLLANNAAVVGNDTTAAELGGLVAWVNTNVSTDGTAGDDGTTAAIDGTPRAFTEDLLKDVLKSGADSGADFSDILVGSFNKQVFSTFNGGSTFNIDASDKKIVNTIDVYVGDFGQMKVHFSPQQRGRDCLIVDRNLVNVAYVQNLSMDELAKTGRTEKRMMNVYYTLEVLNEKGTGAVLDLTTS